jgi:hypothetical protein
MADVRRRIGRMSWKYYVYRVYLIILVTTMRWVEYTVYVGYVTTMRWVEYTLYVGYVTTMRWVEYRYMWDT